MKIWMMGELSDYNLLKLPWLTCYEIGNHTKWFLCWGLS